MEERDEKPPEPLKACAQVSELLFPRETQRFHPGPTAEPQAWEAFRAFFAVSGGLLIPPDWQPASNTHCTFNEAPCLSSPV